MCRSVQSYILRLVRIFPQKQISCNIKRACMCKHLSTLPFVCWFVPVSVWFRVCICVFVCASMFCVFECRCVRLSFSASPVGQLEGDSPIRAGPVVQRLSAVVSDTELSLSLNNCQSALVHSDPSGSLPLSHSNSPLDSHWQPYQFPEPSMALLSSLVSD